MEPTVVVEKPEGMAVEKPEAAVTTTSTAINTGPDWEVPDGYHSKSILPPPGTAASPPIASIGSKLASSYKAFSISTKDRMNRVFPATKTYTLLKLKRRTFLLVLAACILALLALILGLAIGLTRSKSHSSQNLPLPTGADIYHGDLTYYNPGLGACGITSTDNDDIVAIAHSLWDSQSVGSNPNANPFCGRKIRAQRFDGRVGHLVSVDLTVVDRCVGCQPTDLDVSPAAFKKLADPDLGRVHDMSWAWI